MQNTEEEKLNLFRIEDDEVVIEYEYEIFEGNVATNQDTENEAIVKCGINRIEERLKENQRKIDEYNKEIDRLTNHADKLDYTIAVASGVLCGLIDSFFVGEFSFERGQSWGKEQADELVKKIAKQQGYKGDDLSGSVRFMEKFGSPSDSVTAEFGGGRQHHLRDFAHHPTPIGLIFSMITQFTCMSYGTNTAGMFQAIPVVDKTFIGKELPEKITFGLVFWVFHMVSDIAGSSGSVAIGSSGTGLPGPLLSLLKEISSLPIFNKSNEVGSNEFSLWISKLFNGTLLAEHDSNGKIIPGTAKPFDFRAELGVIYELGRQAIPVIINECIVRGFYFVRRLHNELKEKQVKNLGDLKNIEWKKTLPFKNRTIIRMLTISTGVFCAVDMADAAIRGAIKSGGNPAAFAGNFLLHVNFVGLGRFAIAVGTDVYMGVKKESLRNDRIKVISEQMHLMNAKVFYLQGSMWIEAKKTEQSINEAITMMEESASKFVISWEENRRSIKNIADSKDLIEKNNPGLIEEMLETIKWG